MITRRRNCEQNKVGFRGVVKGRESGIFAGRDGYYLVMGLPVLSFTGPIRMLGLAGIGGSRFKNEALTAKYPRIEVLLVLVCFAFRILWGFCGWILSS